MVHCVSLLLILSLLLFCSYPFFGLNAFFNLWHKALLVLWYENTWKEKVRWLTPFTDWPVGRVSFASSFTSQQQERAAIAMRSPAPKWIFWTLWVNFENSPLLSSICVICLEESVSYYKSVSYYESSTAWLRQQQKWTKSKRIESKRAYYNLTGVVDFRTLNFNFEKLNSFFLLLNSHWEWLLAMQALALKYMLWTL